MILAPVSVLSRKDDSGAVTWYLWPKGGPCSLGDKSTAYASTLGSKASYRSQEGHEYLAFPMASACGTLLHPKYI